MPLFNCIRCDRELFYLETKPNWCKYCGKNPLPTRLALKLQIIIKELTGLDVKPCIHRCYPGHWQISNGAFLWVMYDEDNICVGSLNPAKEVARGKNLVAIDSFHDERTIEIIVENENV